VIKNLWEYKRLFAVILQARPRLHCMQRGKKPLNNNLKVKHWTTIRESYEQPVRSNALLRKRSAAVVWYWQSEVSDVRCMTYDVIMPSSK